MIFFLKIELLCQRISHIFSFDMMEVGKLSSKKFIQVHIHHFAFIKLPFVSVIKIVLMNYRQEADKQLEELWVACHSGAA